MDKERAKFVLQSFRPDGADVDDIDFAEALVLATKDRELGGNSRYKPNPHVQAV